MVFVILVIIVAVFAYPLSADKSPNANRMIVELSAKPAGFTQKVLLIPKNQINSSTIPKWISLFIGERDDVEYLPYNDFEVVGNEIIVQHYVDEQITDTIIFTKEKLKIPVQDFNKSYILKHHTKKLFFLLGTDRYGRDVWSRLLLGARVSMAVGIVSVILSISIGILMGALAGWYGGWVDNLVMYLVNVLWSIPTLLLVFAITLSIGKGFWEIFIAIGLTSWVGAARLIRGQVMQVKEMEYITAAKALGFSDRRIIIKHILPNIAGPIMVIAAANFATAILVEAGLSFLGIGVQPPTPSWGLMIKEHYNFLIAGKPMTALIPGIAIMLLVLSFNIIGNALRDILDVRK